MQSRKDAKFFFFAPSRLCIQSWKTMTKICLIPGDGIGQEVIPAAQKALEALDIGLSFVEAEAGFDCFERRGDALPAETLATIRSSDAVLFGATSSPSTIVEGYRSPILGMRRELNLYANIRPTVSLPIPESRPGLDFVVVRENSEGLYVGKETRVGDTVITERVISKAGSERIAKTACQIALQRADIRGRRPTLTVVHKANVIKQGDGLFRESVLSIAREYPEIIVNELLVDACAMRLIKTPEMFDVIVTTNLFGDILSDEASALVGGLGVAPSANIGEGTPVFEPVHGSAPDIAGQGLANPTGAFLTAALMLETLGKGLAAAKKLNEATVQTLSEGVLTADLDGRANTDEFTNAVIEKLK
jgi:homoisocitrate dehydrogenase